MYTLSAPSDTRAMARELWHPGLGSLLGSGRQSPCTRRRKGVAGLLPIGRGFGEQVANVHNSIGHTRLKGGGARLDGASLLPSMIFAEDIRIVGQQGFK